MPRRPTAFTSAVCHATKVSNLVLRLLTTASANGEVAEARRLQHAYFRSLDCRLACASQGWARFGKPKREAAAFSIASLDCRKPCQEPVFFRDKSKGSGSGYRRTCTFGPQQTTRQIMVSKVLRATFQPPDWQFEHRGKGRERAIAEISKHVAAGNAYVAVLDIKDCYASFDAGKVPNLLPLSSEIAQNVLLMSGLNLRDGNGRLNAVVPLHHRAPQLRSAGCLPQGSVASGLAASILLSDLGEVISSECHLIGFVDDLVVLGRTRREVDESVQALEASLLEHRSGRLELKRRDTDHVSDGFEFLGYKISKKAGVACIWPSDDNLDRIYAAFWRIVMRLEDGRSTVGEFETIARKVAAFPSWTDGRDHISLLLEGATSCLQANAYMSFILSRSFAEFLPEGEP